MSELQSLTGTINYDRVYPTIDASLSIEGAAADAKAAGDAVAKMLPKDGTVPMTGDLDMAEHQVKHVADPAEAGDAVNLGYANRNFAPAGYGLGKEPGVKNWSEIDSLYANGWYAFNSINAKLNNVSVVSALVRVDGFNITYKTQTLYAVNTASGSREIPMLKRTVGYSGNWQPWECVNPPMTPGVEYRTTERHNGKPVHTMLFNFGAMPNATIKQVAHNIANVENMLSVTGSNTAGATIPYDTSIGGGSATNCCGNITHVTVTTGSDLSNRTAYLTLRYTKTTD